MTKKTYTQLKQTIAALEKEAESVRLSELADVVSRIRSAIAAYGITEADLFGGKSTKGSQGTQKGRSVKSKSSRAVAKYSDGKGGEWVGRGPRPRWLRDALAAGKSLNDFAVNGVAASTEQGGSSKASTKSGRAKKRAPKAGRSAVYTDGAGHSWSGRGPKPKWFKEAIAGGKSIDDLRA